MLERFRGDDFEYVYEEGRFGYLGNGFSTKELEADLVFRDVGGEDLRCRW
jgi:hypothetical protein